MEKFLIIIFTVLCLVLCSCSDKNDEEISVEGYLESPILDYIPTITVDESYFSYIGKTYDEISTEFNSEGTLYQYEENYEYYFDTSRVAFRFNYEKNEEGEVIYEESKNHPVGTLIMNAGTLIRMDEPTYSRTDLDLILGEGIVSEDYTSVRYSYNGYNITVFCDGETIYPESLINITKQTSEN